MTGQLLLELCNQGCMHLLLTLYTLLRIIFWVVSTFLVSQCLTRESLHLLTFCEFFYFNQNWKRVL